MTPKIILAKYAPDLSRMEPRNIGVFLWAKRTLFARFLEPDEAAFVNESETYERWRTYWMDMASEGIIKPPRGRPVSAEDERCIEVLLGTQKGNYLLVDSGELLQQVGKRDARKAVEFLFEELVRDPQSTSQQQRSPRHLVRRCDELFEATGLSSRADFRRNRTISCPVYGVDRHLKFNYVLGNGTPEAVFERVLLDKQYSVNSATLMLHTITREAGVSEGQCAALVQGSNMTSRYADEGMALLGQFCQVIDVESPAAQTSIERIAANGSS